MAAIELWVFGQGGLKWRSRRNGETHQNEIQDSDRPLRRANPLKKYGYILYHFLLVFKRFFLLPIPSLFSHRRVYAHPTTISPRRPSFRRFRLTPFSPARRSQQSSVTRKSNIHLVSLSLSLSLSLLRETKAEFIKICAIKARDTLGRDIRREELG